jgi:hypothetical protein
MEIHVSAHPIVTDFIALIDSISTTFHISVTP